MLVLTRNWGEEVVIGLPDGREIRLRVRSHRNRGRIVGAKLAFDAPLDVTVDRLEIAEAKRFVAGRPEEDGKSCHAG